MLYPINLQVVPNSSAEIALKEKVNSVLIQMSRT
jgi:hypothetical protein